ncbi:MAG: putative 2-dehydropantoate 2-reductase [Leptolyngbyaceae cyanobacterium SM1_1_3]|nr:putative 2-dehydropantoate 2-reductase [Leptolyngbyaceae cyanobacterium SM1_1_3]NJN01387.1 putative 2-dehydropantoate 2-reductase [Leptolyngbyaceae cyanobacterium RM1_1_2]NJO11147.1 putative 2-dehydropantoate 2-reductase [Leptolyngbyaceae cyanobacterium SL_1_1]
MSLPSAPRQSLSYAILGTGAIGGLYGACLQRAGAAVHFLLYRDYEQVRQQGLRVESIWGDFELLEVQAYAAVSEMPTVDVVIVALKTTQNYLLADLLPPLVGPQTVVLILQNGLAVEATAAAIAGAERILSGLCFVCSNKVGPGHIRHLDYGTIMLGHYSAAQQPAGLTGAVEAIAQDFKQAHLPIQLTEDLYMARWRKLVWNIPFNGLSVVLNATTQEMMADPDIRELAEGLMVEVIAAANACGENLSPGQNRRLPDNLSQDMLEHTAQMKPYRTSMKIDFDTGRPLELVAIFANPIRAAATANISVPQVKMLYQQLQFLNRRQRTTPRPDEVV